MSSCSLWIWSNFSLFTIKKNKNTKLIEVLYDNLRLLSEFLNEFTTNKETTKDLLENLISKCDFTEVFAHGTEELKEKLLDSFKKKYIKIPKEENITDDKVSGIIQLVFDKFANICYSYNPNQENILKHIPTMVVIVWVWQIFNYYLCTYKLPPLKINLPYVTPRFWCTLNPFNSIINLKCLGFHFNYAYFTLDENEANEMKKLTEEWVKKYYIDTNPKLWCKISNPDYKKSYFNITLKKYNWSIIFFLLKWNIL